MLKRWGMVAAAGGVLAGCTTMAADGPSTSSPTAETVTVAVGPCFGFCPVYQVSVAHDGMLRFVGERHTTVIGERTKTIGAAASQALIRDLAPYRPATGSETQVACTAAVSDTSSYTVTWESRDGGKTVATVQDHCPGGPGQSLGALLRTLPTRLGVADWAKQVTRPGVSRG